MMAHKSKGFTLVELMVVVTTIGILALLGMPGIRMARERTQATATANDLRVFTQAIEFYSTEKGSYPGFMTYTTMPEDIAEYLPPVWKNGVHNWFYYSDNNYTYVYLYNLNFTAEQAVRLDTILDDANIATGSIRVANNGRGLIYLFRYSPGSFST
jgi:prepilin-type N-terminal cleavage/methylation domain-containing protein